MSLIEEYYELNEAEEVSAIWKALQIIFYAFTACLGLWCGYTLAILRLRFDDRCYLFTEVKASHFKDDKIDQSNINWESDTWCDYYQFSMVSSFIVAIIWATFFLMCGKGGKSLTGFVSRRINHVMMQREIRPLIVTLSLCPIGQKLPQPWRIVWSSLIFNFIYFTIVLSTAINIQQGTDYFCGRNFDKKILKKTSLDTCEPLKLLLKKDLQITSIQLEIVVKTSWGCAVSWLILFLLSLFRILFVVDFHMYKICVFKIDDSIQNKKEEVLRITNYEEPKQLNYGKDDKQMYISVSDDAFEDLEAGNKRKPKADKKSGRQYFNATGRMPLETNAAFYLMTDLRMLNREKKKKKSSKVLDETFARKEPRGGSELRKSIKIQSNLSNSSEIPKYLYQYPRELYGGEVDEDEMSSSSTLQRQDSNEGWAERSESESEISVENSSLRLRKRI